MQFNKQNLRTLGEFVNNDAGNSPEKTPGELYDEGWRPRLNPTQKLANDSKARYVLLHAEKGSGKSIGGLHKLVEHCFLNDNALAIMIMGVKRQAEEGGIWHKLQQEVLPTWRDGNREMDHGHFTGKMFDDGIGIEFTEPKSNIAKDVFIWIENRHGTKEFPHWSRVLLLSMPVESFVADRVKGMEPSFVLVDEAQTLDSDTYFRAIVQQVGRRPGITTTQQIYYCANPEGPSHWLYKRFWEFPVNQETGEWDTKYERFHIPIQENLHNLPEDYWENVKEGTRGDSIEEARMLRGEWIDRPTGLALFGDDFKPQLCVRGDAAKGRGLMPVKGYHIIFSYDLGAAHTSIDLQQIIPTKDKIIKINFDEMDFVGQYIPYVQLVPKIVKRMMYWDNYTQKDGTKLGPFAFQHISDDSAFNQYRAKDGSFDVWDIEEISKKYVLDNKLPEKYIIKLKACPKGPHSIEARVRLMKDALQTEEYFVSATCVRKIEMFNQLEEDPKERLKPKRSPQIHRLDSGTYGFFYYTSGPGRGRVMLQTAPVETGPGYFVCGRRAA